MKTALLIFNTYISSKFCHRDYVFHDYIHSYLSMNFDLLRNPTLHYKKSRLFVKDLDTMVYPYVNDTTDIDKEINDIQVRHSAKFNYNSLKKTYLINYCILNNIQYEVLDIDEKLLNEYYANVLDVLDYEKVYAYIDSLFKPYMDKQYNYIFFSTNKISDLKMELIGYRITSHAFQLANSIKHDRFLIGGHGLACKVDKPHAINNTSLVLGRNLDYLDLNDTSEVIDLPENNIFSPLKYSQNLINQQDSYTFKDILNKCDVTLDCTPEFEQKTCKSFEYVTSMYCSNKCIFCLNSSHMKLLNTCKNGLITDKRDFDLSCQQIQQYYDAGYNFMLCLDPSINSNLQYLEYLCNYIVKNNLDLKWLCGLNLRNISTHVTDMISEAGCILASIGVETATSNERLEYIGKGFTLEKAAEHLAYLSSKGIFNIINIILGIPNFEKDELKYMRQFIKDSGGRDIFNIIYYYPYVLYPSELSYNVKKKHKIMSIPNTYIFKIPGKTFDETMNLVCEDSFSSSDNVSYLYNVLRPTFFIQYNLIYVLHKYYNGNIKLIMEKLRSSYPDMNFNQL